MQKVQTISEAVARWSVILFATLLPLFVIPVAWTTVVEAKMLLVAFLILVVLIAWIVWRITEGTLIIPRSPILLVGAFLPLAYAASVIFSKGSTVSLVDSAAAQDTVVFVAILYAILLLTAAIFHGSHRAILTLVRSFLLGSLILIVFQLARLVFPSALTLGGVLAGSASSIFGSWHDLGIFAGLLLIFVCALFRTPVIEGYAWKSAAIIAGVGSFVILLVVNTSDVWYAIATVAILLAVYTWFAERSRRETSIVGWVIMWIVLAFIAGASGIWSSFIYNHLPSSMQVVQFEVRPSWQGTIAVGEKVFGGGGNGLLFGSGPNTFVREWGLFKPTGVNSTIFWNVDFNTGVGSIPTALVTVGALGVAAWAALLLVLLWSLVQFLRSRNGYFSGVVAGLFAISLYLMAFHIMYVPGIALSALTFFFLGIVVAMSAVSEERILMVPMRSYTYIAGVYLAAILIVGGLTAYASVTALRATISDMFVNRAVVLYRTSGDILGPLGMINDALLVFPQNDRAHRAGIEIGLLQLSALAASGKTDDASRAQLQAALSETIRHGLAAVAINSADYQNWLALANLYQNLAGVGVAGASESARSAYEKAHAANPTNPLALIGLARLDVIDGNRNAATEDLNKAIELTPNLATAYFLRSQIEASDGTFAAATKDAGTAIQGAPEDPLGWYNLGAIFYVAGKYSDAVPVLQKAISLQNDYSNALFILGLSFDRLGKRAEARAALSRVAELNPNDASIRQLIADLDAGKSLSVKLPQ